MEPNRKIVDHFITKHGEIDTIKFITPASESLTRVELDFFNNLRDSYQKHGIELERSSEELKLGGHSRGMSL
jgi:hypothetical protein